MKEETKAKIGQCYVAAKMAEKLKIWRYQCLKTSINEISG
jgi:hypothetical protein